MNISSSSEESNSANIYEKDKSENTTQNVNTNFATNVATNLNSIDEQESKIKLEFKEETPKELSKNIDILSNSSEQICKRFSVEKPVNPAGNTVKSINLNGQVKTNADQDMVKIQVNHNKISRLALNDNLCN